LQQKDMKVHFSSGLKRDSISFACSFIKHTMSSI